MLRHDAVEIVVELVLGSTDVTLPRCLVARPTSSTKDLQHVQHGQVLESALATVVHLGALNDDRVRRQIDTPSECGGAA